VLLTGTVEVIALYADGAQQCAQHFITSFSKGGGCGIIVSMLL